LGPKATRTVGIAFRAGGFNNASPAFIDFADGGLCQCCLIVNPDGTISVSRNGTTIGSSTQALSTGVYYFIEMSLTVHPTAGAATVKVGGITWISLTGMNTQRTSNSSSNQIGIGFIGGGAGQTWDFDDFYSRGDGVFCNDSRVISSLPTGNGAVNNFLRGGTDSGANWSQVNDNPANDDTNYVQSANAGDIDLYTCPALPVAAGSIYGVMGCPVLKTDVSAPATAVAAYRSGGTVYEGASAQSVSSGAYTAYPDIQGHDPATGAAWTIAGVNAAQFGVQRVT
jgi:hypothetical protein